MFQIIQLVQAGSSLHLPPGHSVLTHTDATPHPDEAGGLQEEGLEAAPFSDALLSFRRKMTQLSHQQRVLGLQGSVFLQDLGKIADGERVSFINPGVLEEAV